MRQSFRDNRFQCYGQLPHFGLEPLTQRNQLVNVGPASRFFELLGGGRRRMSAKLQRRPFDLMRDGGKQGPILCRQGRSEVGEIRLRPLDEQTSH